jgi:hypothetical protein
MQPHDLAHPAPALGYGSAQSCDSQPDLVEGPCFGPKVGVPTATPGTVEGLHTDQLLPPAQLMHLVLPLGDACSDEAKATPPELDAMTQKQL